MASKMSKVGMSFGVVGTVLAASALTVALTHSGPRGPRGEEGKTGATGSSASVKTLGICFEAGSTQTFNGLVDNVMDDYPFQVSPDSFMSPTVSNGVISCGPGYTYVSVVPSSN